MTVDQSFDAATAAGLTEVVTRLRRVLRSSVRADIPWESLPMAQVELLQCVAERDGTRVGELAGLLRLAANTVSTLVAQLVEAGLVRRERDPADRRAAALRLTPAGEETLTAWRQAHEQRIGAAMAALDTTDRDAILAALPALGRLVEALDDRPRQSGE